MSPLVDGSVILEVQSDLGQVNHLPFHLVTDPSWSMNSKKLWPNHLDGFLLMAGVIKFMEVEFIWSAVYILQRL